MSATEKLSSDQCSAEDVLIDGPPRFGMGHPLKGVHWATYNFAVFEALIVVFVLRYTEPQPPPKKGSNSPRMFLEVSRLDLLKFSRQLLVGIYAVLLRAINILVLHFVQKQLK